jgi:hypothetical protein
MYLEVEAKEKSDDQEWQMKMALLANSPSEYGPVIFKAPPEEPVQELRKDELTSEGFSPDVTVKYAHVPTPQEVEETLAMFPAEMVLGLDDLKFAKDPRLANGRSHR